MNLLGPAICAQAVLPGMIERRRGRIVNVASGAGLQGIPYVSAYVTSKAALIRLSESLAAEVREHGISVFAIEPGTVRTALAEHALESPEGRRWMPWFRQVFEEGRDVTAEHSAEIVVWIATGHADRLSGRFLSRGQDLERLAAEAAAIERTDLYIMRWNTPR